MEERCPDYVQAWKDTFRPYMVGCHLENAPPEAVEAFEKYREWSWEQGQ